MSRLAGAAFVVAALICVPAAAEDIAAGFAASLVEPPPAAAWTARGAVYVPAYAAIRIGGGKGRLELATTLSIHNVSREAPLVIERIDYHDTAGRRVQSFLSRPIALKPLATVEAFVPAEDVRGGTGANFIVDWAAAGPIAPPAVEAVMIGAIGSASYSFVSVGRAVDAAPAR
jgi:hypothetical protein